ncbi:MAG: aspartate kinase [Bacteroidales bacterium]|nr:aspartate kinase [Bacteroidales bacterium]
MKVLKFGGSSVATAENILRVKSIVDKLDDTSVIVVSALGGVTDELIKTSQLASAADESYKDHLTALRTRHWAACDELVEKGPRNDKLKAEVNALLDELEGICRGVFLLKVIPETTRDQIVSFGERLSSIIVAAAMDRAEQYNALDFIRTKDGLVEFNETNRLIRERFKDYNEKSPVAIVPGFIARNLNGDISTLGRGGSDYTASILAAALDASVLEIWTDVDGFMTADPRIIRTSYVIDELTYEEATELCNFGAKVIYPPTVYPVCIKQIPIRVKNTFNPDAPGTLIHTPEKLRPSDQIIKGISSIDNISLITLSATSMVGIVGVDRHIFTALADKNISVFLVSQSASETGISIGVSSADAALACEVLAETFAGAISSGAVNPVKREDELAAVAIVGENMKHHCGIAGKLFSTLGRNGISIIALAQGASESNISFVVERKFLRKSLNVIHDGFFLSEFQELNLFVCGIGTVGGQLIEQIASQQEKLKNENNLKINIVGIARSSKAIFGRPDGSACR